MIQGRKGKERSSWWNGISAEQSKQNMNHVAVMEFAAVVQRINTESKYCSAGQGRARFCEFSSVMSGFHSSTATDTQTQ